MNPDKVVRDVVARYFQEEAARRVATIIYEGCSQLRDFPDMGKQSRRMPGRRELPFPPLPYVVVYQVKGDALESPASFTVRRIGLKAPARGRDSPLSLNVSPSWDVYSTYE